MTLSHCVVVVFGAFNRCVSRGWVSHWNVSHRRGLFELIICNDDLDLKPFSVPREPVSFFSDSFACSYSFWISFCLVAGVFKVTC